MPESVRLVEQDQKLILRVRDKFSAKGIPELPATQIVVVALRRLAEAEGVKVAPP